MLKRVAAILFGLTAILALVSGSCLARGIESWPYDKLFKNSDLVIIVKPLSVRDATEQDKAIPPDDGKDFLVGVVTSFEVLHVIKGERKEKKLDLVHFKLKEGAIIKNGPLLISFHTKPLRIKADGWTAHAGDEYMLFLKSGKDKRLEFVSGQFDPELSVKQVMYPLP